MHRRCCVCFPKDNALTSALLNVDSLEMGCVGHDWKMFAYQKRCSPTSRLVDLKNLLIRFACKLINGSFYLNRRQRLAVCTTAAVSCQARRAEMLRSTSICFDKYCTRLSQTVRKAIYCVVVLDLSSSTVQERNR